MKMKKELGVLWKQVECNSIEIDDIGYMHLIFLNPMQYNDFFMMMLLYIIHGLKEQDLKGHYNKKSSDPLTFSFTNS